MHDSINESVGWQFCTGNMDEKIGRRSLCPENYDDSTYEQRTSENYFSLCIALGLAFGRIPVIPSVRFPTHFVTKYISHSKWCTAVE
jgi:hypothetical protein